MHDIEKTLENFGFSPNETRVYLAMLKCGEASVSRIAGAAKLNRITVHHIIARLEIRGLAVRFGKGSQKLIRAAHPARLQKQIQESTEQFNQFVPQLVAFMQDDAKKSKPVVRMYYGVVGFETAAEELLKKPNTIIRHIGSLAEAHKFIGVKYDKEYFIPTRVLKNIQYKTLSYTNEERPVLRTNNADDLREVRYLPKSNFISSNTFIVPGKTIIVTTNKELMVVVIESEDISESEIQKFDLLWNLLGSSVQSPH